MKISTIIPLVVAVVLIRDVIAYLPAFEKQPRPRTLCRSSSKPLPFLIEDISETRNDRIYSDISDVCIQAFFNDGGGDKQLVAPWKGLQLGYLRSLQQSDLKMRRKRYPDTNFMYVARRVCPVSEIPGAAQLSPLILDLSQVHNLQPNPSEEYVRGEILGFVEVTKKPYGLGGSSLDEPNDLNGMTKHRPILTNLSVRFNARGSGVGSKLLQACEEKVMNQWRQYEIVLEVEDDNDNARLFYEKRGYKVMFEDPTSRRYDTTGLWLRQLRCKRQIMRKSLGGLPRFPVVDAQAGSEEFFGIKLLQKLRDSVVGVGA